MILAFNRTRNSKQTYDSMREFELASRFDKLELLEIDYDPTETVDKIEVVEIVPKNGNNEEIKPEKVATEIKPEKKVTVEQIKPIEIIKQKNVLDQYGIEFTKQYTVSSFRDGLSKFDTNQLKSFIKYDTRQTIINEATKELKKRK